MSDTNVAAPAASPAPVADTSTAPVSTSADTSIGDEDLDAAETELAEAETKAEKVAAEKKVASVKKKYEFKSNNKMRSVDLDINDDEEVKKYLSKAFAADEKFEEAAMTRKQAEQLIDMLRTDPLSILRHPDLGLDVKKLAEQVLLEQIEDSEKSPEQKQMEEMQKRLKDFEEEKKKLEDDKRQSEIQKLEMEAIQNLDEQVTAALQKTDLPKSPYVVKRIADAAIEAMNMGYENVSIEQLMPYIEEQIRGEITEMFGAMPDETMEKLLGKSRLDSYRKSRVSKVKAAKATETAKKVQDTGGKPKDDGKPVSKKKFSDVFGNF